jgi:hypothetical protein
MTPIVSTAAAFFLRLAEEVVGDQRRVIQPSLLRVPGIPCQAVELFDLSFAMSTIYMTPSCGGIQSTLTLDIWVFGFS